jgi:hypothetical protein
MFDNLAVLGVVGLLGLSTVPGVSAALSWDICTKNAEGVKECRRRIPRSARIAIAIIMLLVLLLLFVLVVCIIRNRRAAAASEKEYNMEASQMEGPPTIIATEYNRHSGPSPVYSAGGHPKSAQFAIGSGRLSPQPPSQMSGPSFPATVHHNNNYNESQKYFNQTAPVHQVSFPDQPYPFTGYSSQMGPSAPKTAFVSGGFPRPLLAGNRLKEKLRERPASISSETTLVGRG